MGWFRGWMRFAGRRKRDQDRVRADDYGADGKFQNVASGVHQAGRAGVGLK
jgi:hypothetical protein